MSGDDRFLLALCLLVLAVGLGLAVFGVWVAVQ